MAIHRLSFTTPAHWDYESVYTIKSCAGKTDRQPLEKQILDYQLPFDRPNLKAA